MYRYLCSLVISLSIVWNTNDIIFAQSQLSAYTSTLNGAFKVNQNGGSTYSINISVPPGTNNAAPQLTINYNSQGGNGILGQGMSLSGIQSINRTGATYQQDGFKSGINYNAYDRFSLGSSRLMKVSSTGDGYFSSGAVYHTEIESWTKIVANGNCGQGPCSFTVTDKEGNVYEYGNTDDSQVFACGSLFSSGNKAGSINSWFINKQTDLNGNQIQFSYTENPQTVSGTPITNTANKGVSYPDIISYTINEKANLPAQRLVCFYYEPRPDTAVHYLGGGLMQTMARLSKIRTFIIDEKNDTTLITEYQIVYQTNTPLNISRVAQIKEVGANGVVYAADAYDWTNGLQQMIKQSFSYPGSYTETGFEGDFNADGRTDLLINNNGKISSIYLASEGGFHNSPLDTTIILSNFEFIADFNGDGRTDVFTGSSAAANLFLSTGTSFNRISIQTDSIKWPSTSCSSCFWSADFNGDGKSDLLSISGIEAYISFSKGNGFTAFYPFQFPALNVGKNLISDFNGDGLADFLAAGVDSIYLSNWSIAKGFLPGIYANTHFDNNSSYFFSDFNGDNLADLVGQTGQVFSIYLSNGYGIQSGVPINTGSINMENSWLGDYNADGMMDLLSGSGSTYGIYYSNGFNFSFWPLTGFNFANQSIWVGDFNGDGLTDVFNANTQSLYLITDSSKTYKNYNQLPNMIWLFSNGVGGNIELKYQPISNDTIYTKSLISETAEGLTFGRGIFNSFNALNLSPVQGSNYPMRFTQNGMYVVTAYAQTDGLGNRYPYQYHYEGAKVDILGVGWLGFKINTRIDSSAQNVSKTNNLQHFPFTGNQESTLLTDLEGNILRTSRNYYSDSISADYSNGKIYHITVDKSRKSYFDNNTYKYTTGYNYQYDPYGNKTLTTDLGDTAQSKNVVNTLATYLNDTEDWHIGYQLTNVNASDPKGMHVLNATTYTYDSITFNQTSSSQWLNTNNIWLTQQTGFDLCGNQKYNINIAGDTSFIQYDSFYNTFPISRISPPNQWGEKLVVKTFYNPAFGKVSQAIDANSNIFQIQLDALGRDSLILGPDTSGVMTILAKLLYVPDSIGYQVQKAERNDWAGQSWNVSSQYYDGMLRNYLNTQSDQNGETILQQTTYNGHGKIIRQSTPYLKTNLALYSYRTYDPNGRISSLTYPKSNTESVTSKWAYNGKQVTYFDAVGSQDSSSSIYYFDYFNSSKRIVRHNNQSRQNTIFTYDLLGNQISITDPGGLTTAQTYNSLSKLTSTHNPSSGNDSLIYNYNLQQIILIKNNQDTIVNTYDNLNRLLLQSKGKVVLYQFDYDLPESKNGKSKLCSVFAPQERITYSYQYNSYNQNIKSTLKLKNVLYSEAFFFNPNQSTSNIIYPDSSVMSYSYYPNQQLKEISMADHANGFKSKHYLNYLQYDAEGNQLSIQYGNQVVRNADYLAYGKLNQYDITDAQGKQILNLDYIWNDANQLVSIQDSINSDFSQHFSYQPTGRLDTAVGKYGKNIFTYDLSGNLLGKDSIQFAYKNYQVTNGIKNGKQVFTAKYDVKGNLQQRSRILKGDSSALSYDYDVFNRLIRIRQKKDTLFIFLYNYNGQRIGKVDVQNKETTLYISPYYEISMTPDSTYYTKYVVSPTNIVAAVTQVKSKKSNFKNTRTTYYHQNFVNTTSLTTNEQGSLSTQIHYTPFGEQYAITGTGKVRYTFGSKELDKTGLYYFNARYYDPVTTRFISADDRPGGGMTQTDAYNYYAYTLNNPIKYYDPSGHDVLSDFAILMVIGVEVGADILTDGALTPEEAVLDEAALDAKGAEEVGGDFLKALKKSKGTVVSDEQRVSIYKAKRSVVSEADSGDDNAFMQRYSRKPSGECEMLRMSGEDKFGNSVFKSIGGFPDEDVESLSKKALKRSLKNDNIVNFTLSFDKYELKLGDDDLIHSTIAGQGRDVYSAGKIQIKKGNLLVYPHSGHYKADATAIKMTDPMWRMLKEQKGLKFRKIKYMDSQIY
ncbi:MAG: VCBS repeat-containing protein [Saprospiraceae bacterium]|nr:VCBS repeat-containing protein [Saprospiraceae bacterium]